VDNAQHNIRTMLQFYLFLVDVKVCGMLGENRLKVVKDKVFNPAALFIFTFALTRNGFDVAREVLHISTHNYSFLRTLSALLLKF
jgi:hypothetical protein